MTDKTPLDREELLAHRDQLLAQLRQCPNLMRGSLTQLRVRCGQPNCECTRGPGHLKTHLTVNLGGRTRTLYVNQKRRAEIEALLDGYRCIWQLIDKLTEVNLVLLRGERSRAPQRRPPRTSRRRRS